MDRLFLNPWALIFSALAGVIILLYILKLKRVKVPIGSTLLWEKSVQDFRANAPWQKLRWNILMLLQILALLLLAFALARPFIFGTSMLGGRTVVVLDTSASMLARDAGGSRLDVAIDKAGELVGNLSAGEEAMVIAAGPAPRLLSSFTRDKNDLQDALRKVRESAGGSADLNAALRLVSSVSAGTSTRAVIFSDGAVPDLDPFATSDLTVGFYPIGESGENLAITSAGARLNPFSDVYELFVSVHNFYETQQSVDVTIGVGTQTLDVRTLELSAGEREELVFGELPYIAEPIKVALDVEDALSADDEAYIMMPQRRRYKVALSTVGESVLLHKVLESMENIDLYSYDGTTLSGPSQTNATEINVWVVEGDAPAVTSPTASYLFINSSTHPVLPVVAGEVVENDFTADPPIIITIVGQDRGHAVLRFASMGDLRLQEMRRVRNQPWARTIIEASEGPLIVEGDFNGQRTMYLAFDIYRGDFPLRAAFPIFMTNSVNYLGQASGGSNSLSIQAGRTVEMFAPPEAASVEITSPSGAKRELLLSGRSFAVSQTNEIGVYELTFKDEGGVEAGEAQLPVSLVNEDESNIAPSQTLRVQGVDEALAGGKIPEEIVGAREVRVNREFFVWLILIALVIMGAEYYLYHTRAL